MAKEVCYKLVKCIFVMEFFVKRSLIFFINAIFFLQCILLLIAFWYLPIFTEKRLPSACHRPTTTGKYAYLSWFFVSQINYLPLPLPSASAKN